MSEPIEIYQTADGQTQVAVRFEQESVWLSQAQMAEVIERFNTYSQARSKP